MSDPRLSQDQVDQIVAALNAQKTGDGAVKSWLKSTATWVTEHIPDKLAVVVMLLIGIWGLAQFDPFASYIAEATREKTNQADFWELKGERELLLKNATDPLQREKMSLEITALKRGN